MAYALGLGRRTVVVLAGAAVVESEEAIRGLARRAGSDEAMPILAVRADAEDCQASERWALVDYESLLDLILMAEVVVAW